MSREAQVYKQGEQLPFLCPQCGKFFNYYRLNMDESVICKHCHFTAKPDNPIWGEWQLVDYAH